MLWVVCGEAVGEGGGKRDEEVGCSTIDECAGAQSTSVLEPDSCGADRIALVSSAVRRIDSVGGSEPIPGRTISRKCPPPSSATWIDSNRLPNSTGLRPPFL